MPRSPGSVHARRRAVGQVLALCAARVCASGCWRDGTKIRECATNRTAERSRGDRRAAATARRGRRRDAYGVVPDDLRVVARAARRELLDELEAEAKDKSFEARTPASRSDGRGCVAATQPDAHASCACEHDRPGQSADAGQGRVRAGTTPSVVTEDQYVVAADVTNSTTDARSFAPMIGAAKTNLRRAGVNGRVRTVLADAGYWSDGNVNLAGVESLIAPGKSRKLGQIAEENTARSALLARVEAGESDRQAAQELG